MARRLWQHAFLACAAAMALALASLAPWLSDSAERVRLRNALLLQASSGSDFDWTPAAVPADFALEQREADPRFQRRVAELGLDRLQGSWARALAIARHLLENRRERVGQPIQSDLEHTYQRIRASGEGYCGDYADVFSALALAAGLPVRSWAFSFDGFGGRGHIFNEVWDGEAGAWRMIDVFHNYYMTDGSGRPLSALAFRERLRRGAPDLRLALIEPAAKLVFKYEDRAWDFYRRGLDQWYLWWGNAVFSYDRAPLVRAFAPVSRSMEQLGGIAQGVHPRLRVLPDGANADELAALERLRRRLFIAGGVFLLALLGLAACAAGWWRARAGHGPAKEERSCTAS